MKTDVLVVGGGIAGAAVSYYLAQEGVDVVLIEARDLNTQASGTNAGSIHVQIQHPEFVSMGAGWARSYGPTLRLLMASQALWLGLSDELGVDLDVRLTGGLLVATTPAQMQAIEAKAVIERGFGVDIEMLDRDALRQRAPYLTADAIGAGFCPGEGKANPLKATRAFAAAAQKMGAKIITETRMTALEPTRGGYLAQTERGPIAARRVVNAAGAAAADVARMLGLNIELQGFPLQVTVTEPVATMIPHLVYSAAGKLSAKQALNGTCLIGGGWPARLRADGSLATDPASLAGNMVNAARVIPALARARAVRSWTAVVNGTADWRPIIGEASGQPGFFLSLFPWMGFSAGPMTARLTADLVVGRAPRLSLKGISVLAD
ncbi:NAD(P)/FAD-dependent oxidoreductase [Microvirga pudoricolor]|uniref:NAD(P)/FAD-dependent oxidoreductase n=1 Tax=Microvirga pudoricolor TaxID=2778729 RepID=UPI00195233CF|nr:FAD-binding oxidoreductase [Microvirga pudoricolor]MBM6596687.1 FAD-binding oxidoreductase [Microvirga pudoricolor]